MGRRESVTAIAAACLYSSMLAAAENVRYYRTLLVHPFESALVRETMTRLSMRGYSEGQFIEQFDSRFFHLIPRPADTVTRMEDARYIVTEYPARHETRIEARQSKFVIVLTYHPLAKKRQIKGKTMYYRDTVLDSVTYRYRGDTLVAATSSLFGTREIRE